MNPPGAATEKEPSPGAAVNQMPMEFLMHFGKLLLVLYPVYLTGYLGFSISWVLLCLLMWTLWGKNQRSKSARLDTAVGFVEDEKSVIKRELKALNMPAWVSFPEVEKVEWLNKILLQAWPFFGMFMEKFLKEKVQPSIQSSNPALKTFTFTKVHFGQKPLKITGVKAYTEEVDKREVVLDLNLSYVGDVDIDADVKKPITAGVKSLELHGMLRVVLQPLIGQSPLVGGITMFFIRRPTLEINWTGVTNFLDSPALNNMTESAILDVIASMMMLPNRMCIPLVDQVKVEQMRFPLPRGIARVHLVEAQDLVAMDSYMMGLMKGKSDPYAILKVGSTQKRSKTIKETLDPCWHEVYEFVIHEAPGQELEVELYDEDTDKDDFLGRFNLDFGEVKKLRVMDKWFPLEGVDHGKVHLNLQWMSLQTDPKLLVETLDGCSCAMLAVYVDSASNLPKNQSEFSHTEKPGKHHKETKVTRRNANPDSYVEVSVDKQSQKSKVAFASKDPVWEECFTFFVQSVTNQSLHVQVKQHEKKTLLGTFTLPLARLLTVSEMTLDQRFLLERSGANSHLKMKASLRILKPEKPEPKSMSPPPGSQTQKTSEGHLQNTVSTPGVQSTPSTLPKASPSTLTNAHHGTLPSTSSNTLTNAHPDALPSAPLVNAPRKFQSEYAPHRTESASDTQSMHSSTASYRDLSHLSHSHNILSDKSMASSRFDLTEPYPEAILNHQGDFGAIHLTVRYTALRKKLIVVVNACRSLFPCSDEGSDTYVRIYLLPDQSWKHRMKTSVRKKTMNPVFNEKFEFSGPLESVKTRKLDVAVKNNSMFRKRERKDIGMVMIDLSDKDLTKGFTDWFELTLPGLNRPEQREI
uniref:Extended synaptotagmin-3 n=1 Tax=Paramormyrops kingsleyae TaxID=1676925 RepID=A0A3B3SNZ6_9TELE|nr:extended synaptotagmin-3-like [Paramormyrops kingsleyae]